MLTTAGIAFFAASATLATRGRTTGVEVSWNNTNARAALVVEAGEQIRPQRRDDEERREAQRAGLREKKPEAAEQGNPAEESRNHYKLSAHESPGGRNARPLDGDATGGNALDERWQPLDFGRDSGVDPIRMLSSGGSNPV
jgi:hypothetical protein